MINHMIKEKKKRNKSDFFLFFLPTEVFGPHEALQGSGDEGNV